MPKETFDFGDYDEDALLNHIEEKLPEDTCSAHPFLMIYIQGMNKNFKKEFKEIKEKLDPINEYFTGKKAIDSWWGKWKDRIYQGTITFLFLILLAVIYFYTPL